MYITLANIAHYDEDVRETLIFQNLVNDCLEVLQLHKHPIEHSALKCELQKIEEQRPADSKHYEGINGQWIWWIYGACEVLKKLGYVYKNETDDYTKWGVV